MALTEGNRTGYDPTHGVYWRGSMIPYNTFYALLSLFFFFFMALIIRLGYMGYRWEIRKAEKKTANILLAIERQKQRQRKTPELKPVSILKPDGKKPKIAEDKANPCVQFRASQHIISTEIANEDENDVSSVKFSKLQEDIGEDYDKNGIFTMHL